MYFNKNKSSTNIDDEFNKKENILSKIPEFFSKFKIAIFIFIAITIIILMILLFLNRKPSQYLELNGEGTIIIYEQTDYIEPGYKAYDSKQIDLTSEVDIKSNLNVYQVGEYQITYTIGEVTKTRTIKVIAKPEENVSIYLTPVDNNVNVYLNKGEKYKEPGYSAFSDQGNDFTNQVKVTGTVNNNEKGIYKLTYTVIDPNGVAVTSTRLVIVIEPEIHLSLDTHEYNNQGVNINVNVVDEYFDYMVLPNNTKVTQNTYQYKVTENGKYTFTVYNNKGGSKSQTIDVTNIDKVAPTGACSGIYKEGTSTIDINAKDNIGIEKYEINGVQYINNKITINKEMKTANVKIYDKAGNITSISCNLKDENPQIRYSRKMSVNYYNSNSGNGLSYWLYIPEGATENMPLIVYLHGTGSKGNDYKNNTRIGIQHGIGNDIYTKNKEYNAIILMPQTKANSYLNMEELMELIQYIVTTYQINENKISIAGFSEGAYQLSNKMQNNVSYFSAVVLLANYVNNPETFKDIPVITMCGEKDSARNSAMKTFTNEVNKLGGNSTHYTIAGKDHNIVSSYYSVFRDDKYDLVNWMISQTKK